METLEILALAGLVVGMATSFVAVIYGIDKYFSRKYGKIEIHPKDVADQMKSSSDRFCEEYNNYMRDQ